MPDFEAPPAATLVFSSRLKKKKHRKFFKQCLIRGSVSAPSRPSHILLSLNFHGSCLWNGLSECNSRFRLMSPLWSECHAIYRQFLSACGYNAKELDQKKKVVARKFTRKWIWDHFWTRVSLRGAFVPSLVLSYFYHLLSYQVFHLLITLLIPPLPPFPCLRLCRVTFCTRGRSSTTSGNEKPG